MTNFPYRNDETGLDDFDQPIDEEEKTYSIIRFRMYEKAEVIKTGVTLEEAEEHCERNDTHGDGWFDGWREE